ncbi:response regulator transcription factor [uncultured Helcococcus sp.]|uniref:response regulator transcription factor n=1 Tax=uncultured Helcococcus sp. TaxID=1072508 RepID=UPI00288B3902|nr:response regulator transcription factor [uncultured Helcococcus sp.]
MSEYKILVAEDDKAIRDSIGIYLNNANYQVLYAEDGLQAIEKFKNEEIDLIIMDLMMPNMTGEEAIVKLREISYVPIIILSAKGEDYDKVLGLDIGADDYITKPFNPLELVARVKSNLRRFYSYKDKNRQVTNGSNIKIGNLILNEYEKNIEVNGDIVALTQIEYGILELLMSSPNRVFTSDEIYEHVWGEYALDTKTVTVHIRRIREKIEIDPNKPEYLQVVWGIGYKFVDPSRR